MDEFKQHFISYSKSSIYLNMKEESEMWNLKYYLEKCQPRCVTSHQSPGHTWPRVARGLTSRDVWVGTAHCSRLGPHTDQPWCLRSPACPFTFCPSSGQHLRHSSSNSLVGRTLAVGAVNPINLQPGRENIMYPAPQSHRHAVVTLIHLPAPSRGNRLIETRTTSSSIRTDENFAY